MGARAAEAVAVANNFTDYGVDPSIYFHGLVVDIGVGVPPFAETNYWQVDIQ